MFDIVGIDDLHKKLGRMADAPIKVGKSALTKAGEIVKEKEKEVAKNIHNKYTQQVGWKELKRYPIRKTRRGYLFVDIGIKASKLSKTQQKKDAKNQKDGKHRPTYWDKVRGLYYNHYGFIHNRTGKFVAGTDWMNTAFEESEKQATETIKKEIIKELGL